MFRNVLLGIAPDPIPDKPWVPNVGFCRTHLWHKLEPTTQKMLEDAAHRVARAGAKIKNVSLHEDFERVEDAHRWISSFEFSRNFTWKIENHWDKISETLRNGRLNSGLSCSFDRYRDARDLAERCRRLRDAVFEQNDILLTTPVVGEAPMGLGETGDSSLCAI